MDGEGRSQPGSRREWTLRKRVVEWKQQYTDRIMVTFPEQEWAVRR